MATSDSSGLILLEKPKKEIKTEKPFDKKITTIFHEEYQENIEDILILTEEIFLNQIKDGVQLILENDYPEISLNDEKIIKLISQNMEEIQKEYNHDFSLINREWTAYNKASKRRTCFDNLLKGFRKHCLYTEEFASHNCCPIKEAGKPNQNCHFVLVYNTDIKHNIKFVVCELCKKVYYSDYILSLCNKCNVEYYTSLLSPEENPDMLLATWENYHCPQLINEKMKCIQCRSYFYLNMKNGFLTCLNNNCGFIIKPSRILWTCIVCKTEFKNGVKPYNPLDFVFIKKLIQQTILLKHKAHPIKMPCCKLNVFFTDFYHKKSCKGILYQSELNERIIIVCEKCQGINYIDRFKWTCPKCGKRFIDKNNDNNSTDKKNDNKTLDDKKNNIKDNNIEKKDIMNDKNDKIVYFTPQILKYNKPRFKSQLSEEISKFKLNESTNKDIKNEKETKIEIINDKEIENKNEKLEKFHSFKNFRKYKKNDKDNKNNNQKEQNKIKYYKNEPLISRNNNIIKDEIVKKYNTNQSSFRRFTNSKTNENNNENNNEKKEENDKNTSLLNKISTNLDIEKEQQKEKENLSPRIMWKKRTAQKKSKILELYSVNNNQKEEIINNKDTKEEEKEKEKEKKEEKEEMKEEDKKEDKEKDYDIEIEIEKKNYPKSPSTRKKKYNLNLMDKNWLFRQLEKLENETSNTNDDLEKNEESEEENIEDTMVNLLLNEEENEEGSDKEDVAMSDIPGVSEHSYNLINKKINEILERSKIPEFKVEDYIYDKKLGEGGYAVIFLVYKADDESHKEYAMKKILAQSLKEIDKFTKEFELVHSCEHPNILKIYGLCIRMLDQTTYSLYVLMERSKRDWDTDIKKHLKKKKNYEEKELISIMRQLADALLFMQTKLKISHRDIKPQNVLIFGDGIYKIADFGEAKEIKINKEINTLKGTELYMSPALYWGLRNETRNVNHDPYKSDVFSLGFCFLYAAALNFKILYQVREVYNSDKMNKILNQQLNKKYSATFINILSNMLEVDETKRYDFSQLIEAIDANYDKNGNLRNKENNEGK